VSRHHFSVLRTWLTSNFSLVFFLPLSRREASIREKRIIYTRRPDIRHSQTEKYVLLRGLLHRVFVYVCGCVFVFFVWPQFLIMEHNNKRKLWHFNCTGKFGFPDEEMVTAKNHSVYALPSANSVIQLLISSTFIMKVISRKNVSVTWGRLSWMPLEQSICLESSFHSLTHHSLTTVSVQFLFYQKWGEWVNTWPGDTVDILSF